MPIANPADLPQKSEAEQRAFFDAALACSLEAERRAGAVVRHYDLAGVRIRMVFAGHALEQLLVAAIAHLETPPTDAVDATFHVWDTKSTGVTMVQAPCEVDCFTNRGDVWGMASERTRLAFHWSDFSVNVADMDGATFIYWVADPTALPYWSKASPLRTLFHWLMSAHGCQLLHAAAVGTDDGVVLIPGKGGVGKSTTALICLDHGMRYVGDDYLIVRLEPEPCVISLYATAKLVLTNVANFPRLRPFVSNAHSVEDEKAVLDLYPAFAGQIGRALPLKAVLLPRIVPAERTGFGPVGRDLLQHAASFTTLSQLPHAGRATHDFIERMIAAVPNLEIRLGHDFAGVAQAIQDFLADPAAVLANAGPVPEVSQLPLVSVVIPVHDGSHFLAAAVESILAQDYPALEIIVVDDASTDAVEAAVEALPVDVRFFRHVQQAGPAAARNRGIKDASGELVAFLDVDDLWPPGSLRLLVDTLRQAPDAMVARGHGQLFRIDPASGEMRYLGNPEEAYPHYIGAGVYRRDVFHQVGLFDAALMFGEDTDWYAAAAQAGVGIVQLPGVTLLVRRHAANMTRGKSMLELNQFRIFHKMLQRRRELQEAGAGGA